MIVLDASAALVHADDLVDDLDPDPQVCTCGHPLHYGACAVVATEVWRGEGMSALGLRADVTEACSCPGPAAAMGRITEATP